MVSEVLRSLSGNVDGAHVTVLGAAFKPNSDDIRDSPALEVAQRLHDLGAVVTADRPESPERGGEGSPRPATEADPIRALTGADVVVLVTEWEDFVQLDPAEVAAVVNRPAIIDGRNALNPQRWRDAGWDYSGLGRYNHH